MDKRDRGDFDFIIDDGGHKNPQILASFNTLWPTVKPGGLYFIEDLQFGRQLGYRSSGPIVTDVIHAWTEQLLIPEERLQDPTVLQRLEGLYKIPPNVLFILCQEEACAIKKCASDDTGGSCNDGTPITSISFDKMDLLLDGCGMPVDGVTHRAYRKHGHREEVRKPNFCSDEHRRAVEFCSHNNMNKVPMRKDGVVIRNLGELRPYSISAIFEDRPLPRCHNLTDYLSSIKLGTRSWPLLSSQNITSSYEQKASIFSPFGCFVPGLLPPPSKVCNVLGQYNHVIFQGDSITRHLRQAMYMSMKGDFVKGSPLQPQILEKCTCDGQFSEAEACRFYQGYLEQTIQPREIREMLCENASAFWFGKGSHHLDREPVNWDLVNCTDANYRGILLVLGGGFHFKFNVTETFAAVMEPVLKHPKYQQCACLGKVRLLWIAMHAQSPSLNNQFPHQSRDNAIRFNVNMRELFVSRGLIPGKDVLIMDWWNLTANAQSSDGVHQLSDVNMAKAAHILYLVEHWPLGKAEHYNMSNGTPKTWYSRQKLIPKQHFFKCKQ